MKEEFYNDESGDTKFNTMKKIKFHITSNEEKKGHSYLSVYNYEMKRAFNLNQSQARKLIGNYYYCHGYHGEILN